jgi:hypothetical protein
MVILAGTITYSGYASPHSVPSQPHPLHSLVAFLPLQVELVLAAGEALAAPPAGLPLKSASSQALSNAKPVIEHLFVSGACLLSAACPIGLAPMAMGH